MNELNFMKLVQIRARERGFTVFRNNTGLGWIGNTIHVSKNMMVAVSPGDVVIRQARPLHAGLCEGSSDLIGWQNKTGLFTGFETKTESGRLTEKQQNFIDAINLSGGIGRCVRDLNDIP